MIGILLFTLFTLTSPTDLCPAFISIQGELRTPYLFKAHVTNSSSTICVIAPFTPTANILSVSFLPTRCVLYNEDSMPQPHPDSSEHLIYLVSFQRDPRCVSGQNYQSEELFVVALKETLELSPGNVIDKASTTYFLTALGLIIPVFVCLVIWISRSQGDQHSDLISKFE